MVYFAKWKVILVLVLVALGVAFAAPNFVDEETAESLPTWLPHKQVNLGLDLQGGSHLLLEVEVDAVLTEYVEGIVDSVRIELRRARIRYARLGVMGGATQPQAHAQIVINVVDFGMNVQEAGDAPRILHQGSSQPTGKRMTDGGRVSLETGIDYETIRELVKLGHDVGWNVGSFGGYQAIRIDPDTGVYYGASESRKDGQAAGF